MVSVVPCFIMIMYLFIFLRTIILINPEIVINLISLYQKIKKSLLDLGKS
jgi:hypothetical protein